MSLNSYVFALFIWGAAWSEQVAADALVQGPGFSLFAEDIEAELDYMPAGLERRTRSDPVRLRQLVDDIYRREAIVQAAEQADLINDPRVRLRLERARKEELVRLMLEHQQALAESAVPDLSTRALEIYKTDPPEQTARPERIRVRHILLRAATEDEKTTRRVEADALLKRLHQGEDFAALAKEFSEDTGSAEGGGDLGFFTRGRMIEPFEAAAFALQRPGDLSGLVETRFGFHILKMEAREEARNRSFDEVKDTITANLARDWVKQEAEAWRRKVVSPDRAKADKAAIDAFVSRIVQEATSKKEAIEE